MNKSDITALRLLYEGQMQRTGGGSGAATITGTPSQKLRDGGEFGIPFIILATSSNKITTGVLPSDIQRNILQLPIGRSFKKHVRGRDDLDDFFFDFELDKVFKNVDPYAVTGGLLSKGDAPKDFMNIQGIDDEFLSVQISRTDSEIGIIVNEEDMIFIVDKNSPFYPNAKELAEASAGHNLAPMEDLGYNKPTEDCPSGQCSFDPFQPKEEPKKKTDMTDLIYELEIYLLDKGIIYIEPASDIKPRFNH